MTMDSPSEARSATVSIFELAGCFGLELVARLADGSIRRPPMAETLLFTLLPPEEGKVGLLATPEPRFCNLTNTVHGGWLMMMLDTVMALAAQTTLSPGETCPSHETTAKFVRQIFVDSGEGFRMPAPDRAATFIVGPASESLPGKNPRGCQALAKRRLWRFGV